MTRRRMIVLTGLILAMTGCASLLQYKAREYNDPAGNHVRKMENNTIGLRQTNPDAEGVTLNVLQATAPDRTETYQLEVIYRKSIELRPGMSLDGCFFNIKRGNSLFFTIDGQLHFLATDNTRRRDLDLNQAQQSWQSRTVAEERAVYDAPKDLLLKLCGAQSVTVKLYGEKDSCEQAFTGWNLKNLRAFMDVNAATP